MSKVPKCSKSLGYFGIYEHFVTTLSTPSMSTWQPQRRLQDKNVVFLRICITPMQKETPQMGPGSGLCCFKSCFHTIFTCFHRKSGRFQGLAASSHSVCARMGCNCCMACHVSTRAWRWRRNAGLLRGRRRSQRSRAQRRLPGSRWKPKQHKANMNYKQI